MADQEQEPEKANIGALTNAAVAAIGLVAAKALQAHGVVTLQVGDSGYIELVPVGELELDRLSEQEALQELISRNYADSQLADYLRQRAHRAAWKQYRRQMELQKELMEGAQSSPNELEDEHR